MGFDLQGRSLNAPNNMVEARPVRLTYQPPVSSTFLSQQTSYQQSASSTFLSEQISTSHQLPAKRTGWQSLVQLQTGSPMHVQFQGLMVSRLEP
jgi:hypothetical protein